MNSMTRAARVFRRGIPIVAGAHLRRGKLSERSASVTVLIFAVNEHGE